MHTGDRIGVDIGGTSIRAARVSSDGQIARIERAPTPSDQPPAALAKTVARLVEMTGAESSASKRPVGVALPGIRDASGRVVTRAVNLPKLEGCDVAALLSDALRRPVVIESDINAATFAQWRAIPDAPARFAYLSLGTGVAGGVVIDGRLLRHTNHGAGQIGFLVVDTAADAPLDNAGLPGTLSAYLSGPAFERLPEARRIPAAAAALTVAIRQIVAIYAVEVVALGGGVSDACPALAAETNALVRARRWLNGSPPRVIRAPLSSDEAGVIGAALIASD